MFWVRTSLFVASFAVLANCNAVFNISLLPHECLNNKAIEADYTPLGKMINIGDLPVYEYEPSGNVNKKRLLICVHDIYGLEYPNLKQVTDQIASQNGGFRAALPDFFRGDYWDLNGDPNEREEWRLRVTDWNSVVKPDLINIARHYENEGVEEFGIFGMCFGGKVSTLAAIELSDIFKASGLVHPSSVQNEEAVDVKIPMYLMPSKTENDMLPFYEVLQTKFGDNCGHRKFDDMDHGFSGARGNFSDPLIQQRVNEVITTLGAFFDRNLNETKLNGSNSPNIQPAYFLIVTLITSVFIMSQN